MTFKASFASEDFQRFGLYQMSCIEPFYVFGVFFLPFVFYVFKTTTS